MSTNRESPDVSGGTSGRVVVGVHGSPSSLIALRHAVGIAGDRGWELEIVTAWPDADEPLIHDVPGRYIVARGRAVECQRQALATLDVAVASAVDTFLVNARPAQALMSRCRDEDLLVVGAGRSQQERGVAASPRSVSRLGRATSRSFRRTRIRSACNPRRVSRSSHGSIVDRLGLKAGRAVRV